MAESIYMPRLSDTMEKGTVVKWYKKVGETVSEGDVLADIETDKAIQEFESEFDGVLLHQAADEGKDLEVEKLLAIIGVEGEDISNLITRPKENSDISKATTTKEEKAVENTDKPTDKNTFVVQMPLLSDTMTEGTVSTWYKNIGDSIKEGEVLADIETDKATQEFESEHDGVLLFRGAAEGETIPVNSILAIIGEKDAAIDHLMKGEVTAEEKEEIKPDNVSVKEEIAPIKDSDTETENHNRIFASPLAKSLAKKNKIDLLSISGSGPNGRIVKIDVEEFLKNNGNSAVSTPKEQNTTIFESLKDEKIPNSSTRKVIARRLSESIFTAPHYYLKIEVDMDSLISHRTIFNQTFNKKISFNDWIVKAVASSLNLHPKLNSSWHEDYTKHYAEVNIGIAVAVEDGLVVPVVKNTNKKSIADISDEIRVLAKKAREKTIKANEMEGSTFTISNLGSFGIESFTSIINQPNSCILSVGAIVEKPVVKNGEICIGNRMKLNLACDHRVVDGATGSQFLQTLKNMLEVPGLIFQ